MPVHFYSRHQQTLKLFGLIHILAMQSYKKGDVDESPVPIHR